MKTISKFLSILVAAVLAASSIAAQAGYVTGLVTIPIFTSDNKVFVTPSTTVVSPPACNSTNRFVFDSSTSAGKAMLAALLTAKAMGSQVFFAGTTYCTLFSNAEDLSYIQIY